MGATFVRIFVLACMVLAALPSQAAGVIGAQALRLRYGTLEQQLVHNAFGAPVLLQSEEAARRVDGEVYALVEHPFDRVGSTLTDPMQWCDILILHLNTKLCRNVTAPDGTRMMELRVGKKEPQPPEQATLLSFKWVPGDRRADYFSAEMDADDGPYGTRDYTIFVEAVPVDRSRTFLHFGYSFSFGGGGALAMRVYLSTIAREKVGFTRVRGDGGESFIGGVRAVAERNTMRYYLAIDAYLESLAVPRERQQEKRLVAWFDATERYPRQLHEVDRDDYLRMKRDELRRQAAVQSSR